ncbi:MAG TPA: hypothetical protein VF906_06275 [Candidatus Bathyarchaeia archaeon]
MEAELLEVAGVVEAGRGQVREAGTQVIGRAHPRLQERSTR